MSKKKILFIMESLAGGGAEKVFLDLLESFDRNRYEIELLLVFNVGVHLDKIPDDIRVRYIYGRRPGLWRRLREHAVAMRNRLYRSDIRKLLKDERFDCIISFMEGPTLKMHTYVADKAPRNINWCHINLEDCHWTSYLYRSIEEERDEFARMSEIVFVSAGAKEAFKRMFGYDQHLHIIYNIIPTEKIRRQSLEKTELHTEKFTFLNIGRLETAKRQDRLIEAARILRDKGHDFEVWIMGTGTLEHRLRKQIASLGLQDCVKMLGFHKKPYPILRQTDAFVLSSDAEGYPTVICEALTLGKPIVSTLIPGVDEQLGDGAGITVDLTPEALAAGMERILTDEQLRHNLSEKALKKAATFEKDSILNRIYSLIDP